MSFVILLLAGIFASSIKNSISSLHSNIRKFLRSRNVSRTTIHYHDELYDIYNLFCDYSIKIQEASFLEDRVMIEDMENVIGELKDGNFSIRVDNNSKKEVLSKTRVLINNVIEILNAHLNNVLDMSNNYIQNDFSPAVQDGINQDLADIYVSMNTLGEKFSNITNNNMEVAMNIEETNYKITTQINTFKENFQEQLLTLDDMIENITNIYDRMDSNFDISKNIQEASTDILKVSKKYKDFSDNSIDYVTQINDTSSQVTQYLDEIEYYSNKANILSLNTSIKSSQYGEIGNLFGYFNKEFKEITAIFSTNIANIKEIISYNIELGKDFYSQYDMMNYNLLVKKINQISGFAKSIDKNTQKQFEKLTVLHANTDNLYDKNKVALQNAQYIQTNVNDSTGMLDKLVSFLNK
jgi:methyl-accepting chemotaxis protein